MHHPVLKNKVIERLDVQLNKKYIDATAGEGNLIEEILKRNGMVLAIDWDNWQIKKLKEKFRNEKKLILYWDNFANLKSIAQKFHFTSVDGIVFDLGLSYEHLEKSGRGFSFKKINENLDMRINSQIKITASDILMNERQENLIKILVQYGEEPKAEAIVEKIIEYRKVKPIKKVGQLIEIIYSTIKKKSENSCRRIFQALRIAVNNELENLKKGLSQAIQIIKPEGRIAVITFHSLESRIVKKFIKDNQLCLLTDKAIKGERGSQLRVFSLKNTKI